MAYKDLEAITESRTFFDYTDISVKLQEKGMNFSQLKESLSLDDNCIQSIRENKLLSFEDEQKIRAYLDIKSAFIKKEYYFDYPPTVEGHSDKWEAIKLFENMKIHHFSILVDKKTSGEHKYKIIGSINGSYYEKEEQFSYDTSAIIVFASYLKEILN